MKNKGHILFIGTRFFGIEEQLITKFEELGYTVDFFADRPSQNAWLKGLSKINPILTVAVDNYYLKRIITSTNKNHYDKIFVLNGKIVNQKFLKKMKEIFSESEFIYYTYDSLKLYPNSLKNLEYYDRKYTFDYRDADEIEGLTLLPLFYNKKIIDKAQKINDLDIDLLSVCTAHPNRYKLIKEIFPKLKSKKIKIFSYLYLNKLQFIYNKFFIKDFKNSKCSEFHFSPLSEEKNYDLLLSTKAVFDVEHSGQTGLTMRTIETVGFNKKLITTNKSISKYNFYNSNNIFILEENVSLSKLVEFINSPISNIPLEIYDQYEITKFVETLVGSVKVGDYLR
ncbi:hypothetical protein LQ057_10245 [Enterococcus gallinarum]|uniref:hypothetical protein n=1 Tax=Enterococcus gallinarum TaxID=1353 RepID=UPI00201947FF|nr:hypothetical protein [Enterococcus gallinarum]UQQ99767.1 hypothetical protein LQ057_10245 [Enterococcus gallinarum]